MGDSVNQKNRTIKQYNLDLVDFDNITTDLWQMPIIKNDNFIPSRLVGFNYCISNKNMDAGIHFFLDDYQFERIWKEPDRYIDILKKYQCILSPDFSLYLDMPIPIKVWNTYRSRLLGAYYQSKGIKVIPTISWAEYETFYFCFKGIPQNSIVAVSTIGVKKSEHATMLWKDGMREMIKQIKPSAILIYGGKIDFDFDDIKTVYYNNLIVDRYERMKR